MMKNLKIKIKKNSGDYLVYDFEIDSREIHHILGLLCHVRADYQARNKANEFKAFVKQVYEVEFTVEFIIYFLWLLHEKIKKAKPTIHGTAKLKLDKIEVGFIDVFVSPYTNKGDIEFIEQIYKCSLWKGLKSPFEQQKEMLLLQEKN